MDETKIHTGTQIKLKKIDESILPGDFKFGLRELGQSEPMIQAIFIFSVQQEGKDPQPSMVIAIKRGLFSSGNEKFLNIVDQIQRLLPEELTLNLYRFETSDLLARYCATSVEPVYLGNTGWMVKQHKRYAET